MYNNAIYFKLMWKDFWKFYQIFFQKKLTKFLKNSAILLVLLKFKKRKYLNLLWTFQKNNKKKVTQFTSKMKKSLKFISYYLEKSNLPNNPTFKWKIQTSSLPIELNFWDKRQKNKTFQGDIHTNLLKMTLVKNKHWPLALKLWDYLLRPHRKREQLKSLKSLHSVFLEWKNFLKIKQEKQMQFVILSM